MRSVSVLVVMSLVACGSKDSKPGPDPVAQTKPDPAKPDQPKPDPAKPDKAKPAKVDKKLTKEQLAELKKRMKAGWAKQKANQWAEAVPEFEAALVAAPQDQRALAELGWSAMQAGDFPKARKADEQAVRVATDKKVKAAALYNLGLVQDKTGDKAGALKSYLASLVLRPNKIVEAAVGKLGAKPGTEAPFCTAGQKPCDCVIADAFDENQTDQAKCELVTTPAMPVKSFKIYKATSDAYMGSDATYVLDGNELIGVIDAASDRGRHSDSTKLVKAELKTFASAGGAGGHQVLWLETESLSNSTYNSFEAEIMEIDDESSTTVTLCVIGNGKTPTRCPLRGVPLSQTTSHTKTDFEGKSLPGDRSTETTVELTIADDGTATVKLVKGASDEQIAKLVGPHKLW